MKKLILFIIVVIVAFLLIYQKRIDRSPYLPDLKETITPTNLENKYNFQVRFNNQTINAAIIKIENSRSIELIPNFKEKLSSSEIMKNNNCRAGVNGGFYDKEGNPIGLFMSNNNYLGDILVNHPFFNGFFVGIDDGGLAIEGEKLPERGYSFILQSGPLMDGWKPTKLSIINDEAARRVVVVETTRKVKEGYIGEKYFMVLYDPDSHFSGPYLSQVPLILAKLQEQMGTQITLSLNLDGGGASAFYNDNIKLEELSPVGSFFCLL